jgi:hypothetical protein
MDGLNIEIMPGAALDSASEIESIVSQIKSDMEELNTIFTQTAPGMQLEWAETVRSNWESYYNADVPQAMDDMKKSAHNLQIAVETAKQLNQG